VPFPDLETIGGEKSRLEYHHARQSTVTSFEQRDSNESNAACLFIRQAVVVDE
jgi:hypothetical protein